jgi:hypothetical protein
MNPPNQLNLLTEKVFELIGLLCVSVALCEENVWFMSISGLFVI